MMKIHVALGVAFAVSILAWPLAGEPQQARTPGTRTVYFHHIRGTTPGVN